MKRNNFTHFFASALFALIVAVGVLSPAPVHAQISGTMYTIPVQKSTYAAATVALTPAASTTDFLTITGAAGKVVSVSRIQCQGLATTGGTTTITLVKRSAVNTGGTSTALTAVPYSSTNAAASASVKAYTANPTVGTAVGTIRSNSITTGTSPAVGAVTAFTFGDGQAQFLTLKGAAETLSLNAGGVSFGAGTSLMCMVEWTEA